MFLKTGDISAYLYADRINPVEMRNSDDAAHWQAAERMNTEAPQCP